MATSPFIGQLALFSFGFAPRGWAVCAGQLMAINQNQALFSLIGTYYGGDGINTFALPNLQGRTPVGVGNGIVIGAAAGEENHTLSISEVPPHTHTLEGTNAAANQPTSTNNLLGATAGNATLYSNSVQNTASLNSATVTASGGSAGHENRTPFLVMTWCIALSGIFPTRN